MGSSPLGGSSPGGPIQSPRLVMGPLKSISLIQNTTPNAFINNISIAKNGDWMSKRSKRHSLILREPYIRALDILVEQGIYMENQDAIRCALRTLFQRHGIEPFKLEKLEVHIQPEEAE